LNKYFYILKIDFEFYYKKGALQERNGRKFKELFFIDFSTIRGEVSYGFVESLRE